MTTKCNPAVWFEIYVNDLSRATKFYEAVLNNNLSQMDVMEDTDFKMVMFPYSEDANAPNAAGALVWMKGIEAGGNSTIIYFGCDDCAVEESRVVAAGGSVERSKFPIGEHGFIALCFDTEGNCFGLHSMK